MQAKKGKVKKIRNQIISQKVKKKMMNLSFKLFNAQRVKAETLQQKKMKKLIKNLRTIYSKI